MWVWVIVALTVVSGMLSLYGAWDTWQDLKSGRPTYLSLVDYLGISRPEVMRERFGVCDSDGRVQLSNDDLRELQRPWWMHLVDDPKADVCLIVVSVAGGALHFMDNSWAPVLVVISAVWMLVSYAIGAWVVLQHPQLRE